MTGLSHQHLPTQPQPKASSTAQITNTYTNSIEEDVTVRTDRPARSKGVRNRQNVPASPTSAASTIGLIRRTLVKDGNNEAQIAPPTLDSVLPPLTSSNDVDLQLYAIIAIIIKDFVNTWYSKITPDHIFVDEVIHIIAHCCRGLEQRLRHVDIVECCLNDIPALLQEHIQGYRIATKTLAVSSYGTRPHHIYHELYPHPALTPVPDTDIPESLPQQIENEQAYRQLLVEAILTTLLPTEDLQNRSLRILVVDILADLIIGQVLAGKVCEGWFIHDAISKVITMVNSKVQPKASGIELRDGTRTRLEQFGLLSSEKHNINGNSPLRHRSAIALWFWRIMQYGYLAFLFMRYVVKGMLQAKNLPKRIQSSYTANASADFAKTTRIQGLGMEDQTPIAVIEYKFYAFVSTLLNINERMPWITSAGSFWQQALLYGSGNIGRLNSVLDRFLYEAINTEIFSPSILPTILLNARASLFPNNAMGPAGPPPPSPEEQSLIKRRAAESIMSLIPPLVVKQCYGSSDSEYILQQIERDVLDSLGDKYLNKHIMYRILELLLLKLLPELSFKDVSELFKDRGIAMIDDIEVPILEDND